MIDTFYDEITTWPISLSGFISLMVVDVAVRQEHYMNWSDYDDRRSDCLRQFGKALLDRMRLPPSVYLLSNSRPSAYTILPPIILYIEIHRTSHCSVGRTSSFCLQFGNSDHLNHWCLFVLQVFVRSFRDCVVSCL